MLERLNTAAVTFSDLAWGPWLLVLLLGGGLFFLAYSAFAPFRYLPHAWALIRGRFDEPDDPGQITHFQALSTAMAGTIGMGNIGGVALAIVVGGPGAVFWMWMSAIVGIATKFFTCTLAVMYRGRDSNGDLQGGPMYVISEALPRLKMLAGFFAAVGLVGCLPAFQTNQLVQIMRDLIVIPAGILAADADSFSFDIGSGLGIAAVTATVVFGGLPRIAAVASRMVPFMSVLYLGTALIALAANLGDLPRMFAMIVSDAFSAAAVGGGALGTVILIGVQRGAYSNEAGIGTESMAHGAARTRQPVREGLVAMLGPIIDTLMICSATAFMILLSDTWRTGDSNGVTLTANAFGSLLGTPGLIVVFVCVLCFASTTIFTGCYYGAKCFSFLFGAGRVNVYRYVYIAFIVLASVVSLEAAISLIDGCFALMAIPTTVSALLLAPKVKAAATDYFLTLKATRSPAL